MKLKLKVYLGTSLIAFSTLALEIVLSRLLSVTTWYHLAFFAISTAMLGMTAGATTVYLKPSWFSTERLAPAIARACLGYAAAVPVSLVVLCRTPVDIEASWAGIQGLFLVTAACSLPFYFSGIAVTAVLTRSQLPVGRVYASDLIGAAAGCLLVLGGLEVLDAPSLVLVCAAFGALAAAVYLGDRSRVWRLLSLAATAILALSAWANAATLDGIRPLVVKGRVIDAGKYILEEWNSFSRVVVLKEQLGPPRYWGASPLAPRSPPIRQHLVNIDGQAGTGLHRMSSLRDVDFLRFDVTNVVYHLRPHGGACVLGVGGGRDLLAALLFGHERVVGVEVNPILVDLLRHRFRGFAGLADREDVTLVVDEARSYLSRHGDTFSVIQMSMTDTWAATGAGAFSLTENGLYTIEGWDVFLERLTEDGLFTVSRWYSRKNLGETGRLLSLAVATLLDRGVAEPSLHLALVTRSGIATLVLSKRPFRASDLAKLDVMTSELGFDLAVRPGQAPPEPILSKIVASRSRDELAEAIRDEPFDYEPPTDESPYFFNMLRLGHLREAMDASSGIVRGNLVATLTLLGLLLAVSLLTVVTIVVPLAVGWRSRQAAPRRVVGSGAVYFSAIGAGFMCVQIALLQRLSLFLGHPVYALGILLFTMIASTGVGSFLSERIQVTVAGKGKLLVLPVVVALAILVLRFALSVVMAGLMTSSLPARIAVSILLISPVAVLLGFFFPVGMRLFGPLASSHTPWFWALNGIFGVLCSALAVMISIYSGVSMSFYLAAGCYTLLVACIEALPGEPEGARRAHLLSS